MRDTVGWETPNQFASKVWTALARSNTSVSTTRRYTPNTGGRPRSDLVDLGDQFLDLSMIKTRCAAYEINTSE